MTGIDEKLKLIDEIEKIRSGNNVNWMDLLRLSFKAAPEETKQLIRKINSDDKRISELFAKLGEQLKWAEIVREIQNLLA